MAGIFGSVSKKGDCARSLYYGVDYHCHLGTDYAGLAVYGEKGIERKIHDIRGENFRPKFQQDYGKMPGYLRDFDVCMIPFVVSEVTAATDPVKFYEYISQGKPVVSTPMPELVQPWRTQSRTPSSL